jgi:hypothetical protein
VTCYWTVNAAFKFLPTADFSESLEAPVTQSDVPPPAVIPIPTFADVHAATHDLLLVVDNIQAHTAPSHFIIAARAQILAAQSYLEAHYSQLDAIAAHEARVEALQLAQSTAQPEAQ